jgi:hypothetical protein
MCPSSKQPELLQITGHRFAVTLPLQGTQGLFGLRPWILSDWMRQVDFKRTRRDNAFTL